MKFSAEKNILAEAVINASKACAVKTAFSALDGVLLSLRGNRLTVTGYDLETGIRVNINAEGETDGDIIVEARLFSDIIRKMPENSNITVEVKEKNKVSVNYGKIKLNIQGTSGESFPNIIELNRNISFKIKEKELKNILSQISHAVAKNDVNPTLRGAKFDIEDNMLYIIATDAMRLALRKMPLQYDDIGFIVPDKAVTELIRNMSDGDGDVDIVIDRNQSCFSKENYTIFSRLLDGKYVDYKKLTESKTIRELTVNTREFTDSLERSLLFINERFKNPVICEIDNEDSCMRLSCVTGLGEFNEEIGIMKARILDDGAGNADNKIFRMAFNPRFMIDVLKNSNCDEVRMEFVSELAPIKITPLDGDDVLFVVVPVRIK